MSKNTQTEEKILLNVGLVIPVFSTHECQTIYSRICLTGFPLQTKKEPLVPVNMALVIDTSMSERKIYQAQEAAMTMVMQLRPTDQIAIVTSEHQGKILLPATKVQNREVIYKAIQTIAGNEQTALFGGLKKGAREILKCQRTYRIDRMILLSDGLANMTLYSPTEIIAFARVLEKNISITTIGLGVNYNKDLMMQISQQSGGNHAWIENTTDAVRVFEQEFFDLAWVVAREVEVTLTCAENVRPLKVSGRQAKFEGQTVSIRLNQVHSELETGISVQLEIPPLPNRQKQTLANITVAYRNLKTRRHQRFTQKIMAICVDSELSIAENIDATVMTVVVEPFVEEEKLALQSDEPAQIQEAKQLSLF